jgi:hypothetical protein
VAEDDPVQDSHINHQEHLEIFTTKDQRPKR